jgi:hypothetical protein
MGGLSDYLENALLDHLFQEGGSNYTPPTLYAALSTTDPTEDGSGITEPAAVANYARVEVGAAYWSNAANGAVENASNIAFNQANLAWGNISHLALFDANAAGNMIASAALPSPVTVGANDTPFFEAGNIQINLE